MIKNNLILYENLDIYKSYKKSKYLSIKHSSYFQTYEDILSKYRNRSIIFVEIGVLNGGSLFMWRDYFGPLARIIGVDFNPDAKRWEEHGFEIFIGDQSSENFWEFFFGKVGNVDIVLDDGGHTNIQQVVSSLSCIPNINDGGVMIVEDTHASYLRDFGNPSKYSFISFFKGAIDSINSRFPAIRFSNNHVSRAVYSVAAYESIVAFFIDRKRCFISDQTTNDGLSVESHDFRYHGTRLDFLWKLRLILRRRLNFLKNFPGARKFEAFVYGYIYYIPIKINEFKIKKYFK